MIRFWFIFFSVFILQYACAQDKGTLKFLEADLKTGDVATLQLELWPSFELSKDIFEKEYLGKKLLGAFFVTSVNSFKKHNNNEDVSQLELKAIVGALPAEGVSSNLALGEKHYQIDWDRSLVVFQSDEEKQQDFVVVEQGFQTVKTFTIYIILIVVGIFGAWIFWSRKQKIDRERKRILRQTEERRKQISIFREMFENAKTREHFEKIFSAQGDWQKLLGKETYPMKSFLEKVALIQFKKEWLDTELMEVITAFDEIRHVWKKVEDHGI